MPHPADDHGLLGHDLQLTGMDEAARSVTEAAVAERLVAAVPAVLKQTPHSGRQRKQHDSGIVGNGPYETGRIPAIVATRPAMGVMRGV